MFIRVRQGQIAEEHVRHVVVVVLAGVHEHFPVAPAQTAADCSGLDELRPRAHDGENSHASESSAGVEYAGPPAATKPPLAPARERLIQNAYNRALPLTWKRRRTGRRPT